MPNADKDRLHNVPATAAQKAAALYAELRVQYESRPVTERLLDWPKCDLCGSVMARDEVNTGAGVFAAICPADGFTLSFKSCRKGHRHCAWEQMLDLTTPRRKGLFD